MSPARLEGGLTVLATVGSSRPSSVCRHGGIYHALIRIGQGGNASMESGGRSVGEALIMTAIGLGVAIPAVLAVQLLRAFPTVTYLDECASTRYRLSPRVRASGPARRAEPARCRPGGPAASEAGHGVGSSSGGGPMAEISVTPLVDVECWCC